MPSIGVSGAASNTSRAVPSPPANIRRSTPQSAIAAAAARVSSAPVTVLRLPIPLTVKPRLHARSAPIPPAAATMLIRSAIGWSKRSARPALAADSGGTSMARARMTASAPSVPFWPQGPPMPAIGLMTRPSCRSGGRSVLFICRTRRLMPKSYAASRRLQQPRRRKTKKEHASVRSFDAGDAGPGPCRRVGRCQTPPSGGLAQRIPGGSLGFEMLRQLQALPLIV